MSYQKITQTQALEALNRVAASEDGQVLLAMLASECMFFHNYVNPEKPEVTAHYAAMRGIYGRFRANIDRQHLKVIENDIELVADPPKKVEKDD